ncbi:MAG: SoxR reducing system RseC family protein [Clostridiales bacterium]|jgi:positive regulator of sigma E activity|nr:SoxR reducing system RseC family protein [Clostridiales bacterium]
MAEQGIVKEFHTDGTVTVGLKRTAACNNCQACMAFGSAEMVVRAKNPDGASVGDSVSLFVASRQYHKAVLLMYAWPLVAALLGAVVGFYGAGLFGGQSAQELIGFLCAFGFAALVYLFIHQREKSRNLMDEMPVARRFTDFTDSLTLPTPKGYA